MLCKCEKAHGARNGLVISAGNPELSTKSVYTHTYKNVNMHMCVYICML